MFLPNAQMEQRAWGRWLFYMATVGQCQVFPYISYVWDGKVVWLHICKLATIEAPSRATEPGFLNTLMWYAGFMHNSARDGFISVQENILLWRSLQIHLCSRGYVLFMQLTDRYKSAHICGSVRFYYTFMIFHRCTALEDTERGPAVRRIHLSSIWFNSIQVRLD